MHRIQMNRSYIKKYLKLSEDCLVFIFCSSNSDRYSDPFVFTCLSNSSVEPSTSASCTSRPMLGSRCKLLITSQVHFHQMLFQIGQHAFAPQRLYVVIWRLEGKRLFQLYLHQLIEFLV